MGAYARLLTTSSCAARAAYAQKAGREMGRRVWLCRFGAFSRSMPGAQHSLGAWVLQSTNISRENCNRGRRSSKAPELLVSAERLNQRRPTLPAGCTLAGAVETARRGQPHNRMATAAAPADEPVDLVENENEAPSYSAAEGDAEDQPAASREAASPETEAAEAEDGEAAAAADETQSGQPSPTGGGDGGGTSAAGMSSPSASLPQPAAVQQDPVLFERAAYRSPALRTGAIGMSDDMAVAGDAGGASLFDRYASESSSRRMLSGNGATLTSRLRSTGKKLACYLNTECNRGRSTIIHLPEACDTLGEVFPLIQRRMRLDERMLYAAELFLPDGVKISNFKMLSEAAAIDTAVIVGCGEPFDGSTVPQSMLSFHQHGGGRDAAKVHEPHAPASVPSGTTSTPILV